MTDSTQSGPGPIEENHPTRPVPKGLLIGGVALLGAMVVLGSLILSGDSEEAPTPFHDAPEALAGDAEAGAVQAEPEDPTTGEDFFPIGLADPQPAPVAPWVGEQTRIKDRLEALEQDLERLRQRHAVVAADLDTLVAGEPWAQTEGVSAEDNSAALEALQAQAERLQSLEARLQRLEAERQARARAEASAPPFQLVAIEWWSGEPYATVRSQGRYMRVQEGDSVSGWALDRIDAPGQTAAFRRAGRVVQLTVQGG